VKAYVLKIQSNIRKTVKKKNIETSEGTCFAAILKSGCQSQDSSRANPEAIGSPITLCPSARKQTVALLLKKPSYRGTIKT